MTPHPATVKQTTLRRRAFGLAALLVFSNTLLLRTSAQVKSPAETTGASGGDVIVLSPFVVDASEDTGYHATNTLAGTRLRSSLNDIASPISVYTKDLLKDIAATNFQDAMLYSVNVENENEYAPDDTEGESISSTTQNRVRGLASSTQTRGFFKTNFRADTYNTDRLTVASGPNSILFGIGSPAGVIDASPITAGLKKMATELSFRADNNGSLRGTLDFNIPVVKNVFALRVAELRQKNKTFRKPEFDDEKRDFVTATYQPFKSTTIRANYEHLTDSRVRARDTLMVNNVSDWIALGKPVYDFSTKLWSSDNGKTWVSRPDLGNNWINTGTLNNNDRVFIAGGGIGGSEIQALVWNNTGLSYNRNKVPTTSFSDGKIIATDVNYYGLGDRTRLGGESYSVVVEQKFTKDLFAEVAYNKETNDRNQVDPFRTGGGFSTIQADVNYFLPFPVGQTTGTLVKNPNVGRYYIESQFLGYTQNVDLESKRAMLSYALDFNEHGHPWFGRYNFGVMWQKETTENFKIKQRMVNQGAYYIGTDVGLNNVTTRTYLDLPGLGGDSKGVEYPGNFQTPLWPTIIGGIAGDGTPQKTRNEVTGKLFVSQASLFKDSLILTFGYRKDQQDAYAATFKAKDPVTGEFIYKGVDVNPTPIIQAGITRTYGAVFHTPVKWLSLIYNRSNAFNPQGDYHDWFNKPLPPGSGKGEDYGISVQLNDKLSARISRFTNTAVDNVEFDWFYEEPKWSVVGNMDEDWGNITGYARKLGNTADINVVAVSDAVRATRDFKSEGYEMELFYKPVDQLDLRFTLAEDEATNLRVVPGIQAYVASRLSVWQKYYGYTMWHYNDAVLPAWDPNWATNPDTIGYQLLNNSNALPRLAAFKASEGSVVARGRKWRGNLIANYKFTGALKGFSAGGGARWRSSDVIGYYGKQNSLTTGGPLVEDLTRPINGKDILLFDGWVGYSKDFVVAGKPLGWTVQLNVRNLLNDHKIVPVTAYTDGRYTAYSKNEPITVILTNTFKF